MITEEQIVQMCRDDVGLIPVVKLIREVENTTLYDAKLRCDTAAHGAGLKWNDGTKGKQNPAGGWVYMGNESDTFTQIKEAHAKKVRELPCQKYIDMIKELLSWAESVEGHKVSNNITKTPGSIFHQARKLVNG